ncbi:hypothetical protein SAMN02745831_00957 [Streptomyces sp. PgraA7]|nr:hypothetical protein SAMN02745831_00957 [Streptomyces sp. PgraA7]
MLVVYAYSAPVPFGWAFVVVQASDDETACLQGLAYALRILQQPGVQRLSVRHQPHSGPRANHVLQPAQPSRTARTFPAGVPRTAPPTRRRRPKHARVPHQPACIALACDGSRRHARWESCRDQISTARHFLGSTSSRGWAVETPAHRRIPGAKPLGVPRGEQGGDSSGASQEELPVQEVLGARVRSQPRNARKIWYAVNPSPPQAIPRPTTAISAIRTWPYRDWRAEARLGLRGS